MPFIAPPHVTGSGMWDTELRLTDTPEKQFWRQSVEIGRSNQVETELSRFSPRGDYKRAERMERQLPHTVFANCEIVSGGGKEQEFAEASRQRHI